MSDDRKCVGYSRYIDCPLSAQPGDVYCEGCRSAVEESYAWTGRHPDDNEDAA